MKGAGNAKAEDLIFLEEMKLGTIGQRLLAKKMNRASKFITVPIISALKKCLLTKCFMVSRITVIFSKGCLLFVRSHYHTFVKFGLCFNLSISHLWQPRCLLWKLPQLRMDKTIYVE